MPEILVVGFRENIHRAAGVLDELRVLDDKWILDLADAVAIHRDPDGAVAMDQCYQPTGRRTGEWGGTLGVLLGASLSIPSLKDGAGAIADGVLTAAALARVGLAGIDASFWTDALGISTDFFQGATRLVPPGDSAIYAVLEALDPALAASRFQRYGGTPLHLSLGWEQQVKVERILREGAMA
jgi:uncharacterized membrane protein